MMVHEVVGVRAGCGARPRSGAVEPPLKSGTDHSRRLQRTRVLQLPYRMNEWIGGLYRYKFASRAD
jgi:hypothetical protein